MTPGELYLKILELPEGPRAYLARLLIGDPVWCQTIRGAMQHVSLEEGRKLHDAVMAGLWARLVDELADKVDREDD